MCFPGIMRQNKRSTHRCSPYPLPLHLLARVRQQSDGSALGSLAAGVVPGCSPSSSASSVCRSMSSGSICPRSEAPDKSRRDVPKLAPVPCTFSRARAIAAAHDQRGALADLQADFFARGVNPNDKAFATWSDFHRTWFGDEVVLPLYPDKIEAVSAMFKKGCYRSFKNYMAAAKAAHIDAGYPWSLLLDGGEALLPLGAERAWTC